MSEVSVPTPELTVRVVKFWTEYKMDGATKREIEWVELTTPGMAATSTTCEAVSRLSRVRNGNVDARWPLVEPAYQAWKRQEALPDVGMPLAAWPGLSVSQADALRAAGIRTVEEVAGMTETTLSRVPIMDIRRIRDAARQYLGTRDISDSAAVIASQGDQIANLEAQLAEMKALLLAPPASGGAGAEDDVDTTDAVPAGSRRGPGRPRKDAA